MARFAYLTFFLAATNMLLDVRTFSDCAWDEALRPAGLATWNKESFETWWQRHLHRLDNLHPQIAEQWVYKYWDASPYCHVPIKHLSYRLEEWTVEKILSEVGWIRKDSDDHPVFNFEVFHGKNFEPGLSMDATGTWNIPPVFLESPTGFLTDFGEKPETRYWLIEGHQRRRYLHALACKGEGAGKPGSRHQVFVLSLKA